MTRKLSISFILIFAISMESWATTGTPSTIFYSAKTNASVSVVWTLLNDGSAAVGFQSSPVGTFQYTSGATIGTDNIITTLSITCVTVSSCTSATETFTIPTVIINTALASGASTIQYSRRFATGDNDTSSTGVVRINILNTNLSISRESLRYSDNSTHKLVKPNVRITAMAELRYTGSGLLNAYWEVAAPTGATGEPIYTRLRYVNRYLGTGGRVILQSPPLPTHATGQYVARLHILKTSSNPHGVEFTNNLPDGLPILRYSVINAAGDAGGDSSPPIKTNSPSDNVFLQTDTLFSWQSIKGADAYQLELYLLDYQQRGDTEANDLTIDESIIEDKKPAAGLLIPANKTSLSLSALARDMLRHRQTYYWRIIAIGNKGQILTTSSIKKIRTP